MYCTQNNRIYCSDCNKSYIPNNYSNHLKSRRHSINVMKKQCCSCNNDLSCCMSKLSLKSCDNAQIDISNKQEGIRNQSDNYKSISADIFLSIYKKQYSGCYNNKESNVEGKALLTELCRIGAITWKEYIEFLSKYHE